ncbi:hypothetical protein [Pseudomonas anguilliseptica]|uniref:TRAFAC clade GTPase domain-containing protein n=1 Tax=Pseudomonas anguilliseptica TaxID=53406 RepID=UPI0022AF05FB|nr:hypothetical protein [Pseudomonas anguilliseptica]MCZ4323163.1 hypothetical protein [Pseudomonas anguilliseptica]
MQSKSIILIGGPDSGKTNYLARLWPSFRHLKGKVRADKTPTDISYVDSAVEHLMKGEFAPRSDRNLEIGRADFSIDVRSNFGNGELCSLMIPDISGELWNKAVATSEISAEWLDILQESEGAVLFVRHASDQMVQPLDWVTARSTLNLLSSDDLGIEENTNGEPADQPEPLTDSQEQPIPTQVLLCELLRYLSAFLADRADGSPPKVSVVIAAWDMVGPELRDKGPKKYLEREFPLFAGRLACESRLSIKIFGTSIVGGDLNDDPEFKATYFDKHITEHGYVVVQELDRVQMIDDITLPIAWAIGT